MRPATTLALGFFATSMAAPSLARRFAGAPIARGAVLLALGHALQFANFMGWDRPMLWHG